MQFVQILLACSPSLSRESQKSPGKLSAPNIRPVSLPQSLPGPGCFAGSTVTKRHLVTGD